MENRRRTRNYFPEPTFQIRFLRLLVFGAALQMCLIGALLYYFLKENYTLLVKYAALDDQMSTLLYRELKILIAAVAGTFLVYLAGLTALGIVFSHRIAGAMYAIKRTIRQINEGRNAELKLRANDEFREIQEEFNKMVQMLRAGRKAV
jgi:signal transduction histidine kinase